MYTKHAKCPCCDIFLVDIFLEKLEYINQTNKNWHKLKTESLLDLPLLQ